MKMYDAILAQKVCKIFYLSVYDFCRQVNLFFAAFQVHTPKIGDW